MLAFLLVFAVASLVLPLVVKLLGPRAFYLAALVPVAAFVHAISLTPHVQAGVQDPTQVPFETYAWIPQLGLNLSMRMDTLSWVMTLIVTGIGALVLLYCRWYFTEKSNLTQFAPVLLAFAGAMYGLVLTDDFVMLVMFWEITSILSYLLIGYFHSRAVSRRSALQALLVTTLGGLVMFVGVVLLVVHAGTTSISTILADAASGTLRVDGFVNVCLALILVGALSKSAIFPFHFWLPGAMAAPTPVSAYLHAAAMVKAGIYLVARLAPTFALAPVWRPMVVGLGIFTMLLGGVQALRETDLKRILAFGTVSQLGFFTAIIGFGTPNLALAGLALVVAHAMFKSLLFLVVGIIDHELGTRDVNEISGVGRKAPALAIASIVAVASMVGFIPTMGYLAKENTLAALLVEAQAGSSWGLVALIGVILGATLTAAYGIRFLWGAFAKKPGVAESEWPHTSAGFVSVPVILATLTVAAGFLAHPIDRMLQGYAQQSVITHPDGTLAEIGHLALWHGLEPALLISLATLAAGAFVFWLALRWNFANKDRPARFTAQDAYYAIVRSVDRLSLTVTSITQRGSLPVYVATIFVVLIAAEVPALLATSTARSALVAWQNPIQLAVMPLMIVAGILAVNARKRYTAVALVSVTGLSMVVLFATSGAPDLAVTQVLVETVTLVTFALVLRRLPARMGDHNVSVDRLPRAILAGAVGVTIAVIAIVAMQAGEAFDRVGVEWIAGGSESIVYTIGHGKNAVNVALVDMRGWDTMGELTVLVLAATGVASLVFVTNRHDGMQFRGMLRAARSLPPRERVRMRNTPLVETTQGIRLQTRSNAQAPRAWLVGGQNMRPESRSILLEVIVRFLFHSVIVISIYVLFAGHNAPGGGFAGGLIAGMALVMRYIAGGQWELGAAAPTDAGYLLGSGMLLAVGSAMLPLAFGQAPLESTFWSAEWPVVGHIEFGTSTFFDIGVYLVVIGLVLDVLRSLGAEVDRQTTALREAGVIQ